MVTGPRLYRCKACHVMVAGKTPKACPICGEKSSYEYVGH